MNRLLLCLVIVALLTIAVDCKKKKGHGRHDCPPHPPCNCNGVTTPETIVDTTTVDAGNEISTTSAPHGHDDDSSSSSSSSEEDGSHENHNHQDHGNHNHEEHNHQDHGNHNHEEHNHHDHGNHNHEGHNHHPHTCPPPPPCVCPTEEPVPA